MVRVAVLSLAWCFLLPACYRARDILEPVPGAMVAAFADSARDVIEAAAYAITDEGIPLRFYDRKGLYVQSEWIDLASVRTRRDPGGYFGNERTVKFQFRARRVLGATELVGEAIHLPAVGEGRANERMVPEGHPGREVLQRLFAAAARRLEAERAKEAERARREAERPPDARRGTPDVQRPTARASGRTPPSSPGRATRPYRGRWAAAW